VSELGRVALGVDGNHAAVSDIGAEDDAVMRFELEDDATPNDADSRRCLAERLASQRFECAQGIACAYGRTFAIPAR